MTYQETREAALRLTPEEQDKLFLELQARHVERRANALAENLTGWKKKALYLLATLAAAAAAAIGGAVLSSCTYNATTATTADGATQSTTAFECKPGELLPDLLKAFDADKAH